LATSMENLADISEPQNTPNGQNISKVFHTAGDMQAMTQQNWH